MSEVLAARDSLHRFVFTHAGIRGVCVRLNSAWSAVRDTHAYPVAVRDLLGEALAAVTLLSATIKLQGSLILQAQGQGPMRTLVAQASASRTVRGLARWEGEVSAGALERMFGRGHLALSTHTETGEPYQGIVPLGGGGIAAAVEYYFRQSEQLPTRVWLATSADSAAGLLLQSLPEAARHTDDWNRLSLLADTISAPELRELPIERLIARVFSEDDVRLFESEPVAFRCGCSRRRIEQTLSALGPEALSGLAEADGSVEVVCEFCNRCYHFDRIDVDQAMGSAPAPDFAPTVH
jgi:molecular chaperone Hsp33